MQRRTVLMFGRFKYGSQPCNVNSYICSKRTSSGIKTKTELLLDLVGKNFVYRCNCSEVVMKYC